MHPTRDLVTPRSGQDSEMIIWGGSNVDNDFLNTGARYDPDIDSWVATSTPMAPRVDMITLPSGPAVK